MPTMREKKEERKGEKPSETIHALGTWQNDYREHAYNLAKYTFLCIPFVCLHSVLLFDWTRSVQCVPFHHLEFLFLSLSLFHFYSCCCCIGELSIEFNDDCCCFQCFALFTMCEKKKKKKSWKRKKEQTKFTEIVYCLLFLELNGHSTVHLYEHILYVCKLGDEVLKCDKTKWLTA